MNRAALEALRDMAVAYPDARLDSRTWRILLDALLEPEAEAEAEPGTYAGVARGEKCRACGRAFRPGELMTIAGRCWNDCAPAENWSA